MKKITALALVLVLCLCLFLPDCRAAEPETADVNTTEEYDLLLNIVEQIRQKTDFVPEVALVLGSGLGDLSENMDAVAEIPYDELRGMPVSTAPGHKGSFLFGFLEGVPAVIMQGRVHCYEGYSSQEVVRPIRVMKLLGADTLILTNSSGAVNTDFHGGEIMMITGHILYGVPNPLIGANIDQLGERFTDMQDCYDPALAELARKVAEETGIELFEGVYLQDTGPSYETADEMRMFRIFGADAVGMSTAIETIAARHMGMKVCGFSCVTCAPSDLSADELNAETVNATAEQMTGNLGTLIQALLRELPAGE